VLADFSLLTEISTAKEMQERMKAINQEIEALQKKNK
jgi:hypothetical protein